MYDLRSKNSAGVAGSLLVGLTAIGAALVPAVTPLVNSPEATATATAWNPRPQFGPKPVPQPRSGVGQTTKPQSPAGNAPAAANDWASRANQPYETMQTGLGNLSQALNNSDLSGVQAACRQLSSASATLAATLPSPKANLTAELQSAIDEINAMSGPCLSDSPDIDAVVSHATAASNHMSAAAS